MISQVYVLSPRGDCVIFKDFKGDISKSSTEVFYQHLHASDPPPPPVFQVGSTQFYHLTLGGLHWVATSRGSLSPSLVLELLVRLTWICRDYFGAVSEDAVRRNFLLVYELLDEIMDYGVPQNSSTERLRQFIALEPATPAAGTPAALGIASGAGGPGGGAAWAPAEVIKSVLDTSRTGAGKEEIFVDVVERLTAVFDGEGRLKSSTLVGAIQVKSYLADQPVIRLGLVEGLRVLVRSGGGGVCQTDPPPSEPYQPFSSPHAPVLDSVSLHDAVDAEVFDRERVLQLAPPKGHFVLMSYRSSRSFHPPFRLVPRIEADASSVMGPALAAQAEVKLTLRLRLRAEFGPQLTAAGVEVAVSLPRGVIRAVPHLAEDGARDDALDAANKVLAGLAGRSRPAQRAEWVEKSRKLIWTATQVRGGREISLKIRLTVARDAADAVMRDYGPIALQFVLPGKPSASGLDVRYMKILKDERGYSPSRWFRVVALANSYQIRPHAF